MRCCHVAVLLALFAVTPSQGSIINVEPDNYSPGGDMSSPGSGLHLWTALNNNQPVPLFTVLAAPDGLHSTGTQVFSHVGIPFFNDIRRLRIDFDFPAQSVAIDYISSGFFGIEFAHLDVYGAGGVLLQSVVSNVNPAGTVQTLSITRPGFDIAFAIAYSDGLTFGRFDNLSANVNAPAELGVPEPATGLLFACGFTFALGAWLVRNRQRCLTSTV